ADHEQIRRPVADVLVVLLGRVDGGRRDRLGHVSVQLLAALIEAHHRAGRVVRSGVQLQHVLHPVHELPVYPLREAPTLLLPRLEVTFLRTRRMVSSDTDSTTSSSTNLLASIRAVHVARPSGVGLHARAMTTASAFPSSRAGPPDRGRSFRAESRPPVANRRRTLATVWVVIPRSSAMSASVSPASARSRICTRFRCRRVSDPANRPSRSAR